MGSDLRKWWGAARRSRCWEVTVEVSDTRVAEPFTVEVGDDTTVGGTGLHLLGSFCDSVGFAEALSL